MIFQRLIYIIFIAFFFSCTSRTIYKKPKNLISKEQMIDLWTDIYIANAAKTVKNNKLELKINYMPLVYKKYNIDSARFMESNIYYTSKIEDYEKMFNEVLVRIKKIKEPYEIEEVKIEEEILILKPDSLLKNQILKKGKLKIKKPVKN